MADFRGAGDELVTRGTAVRTRADFEEFLQLLLHNLHDHPEEWENASLVDFLSAMSGFVRGLEGYYANFKIDANVESPSWRTFAEILLASRIYE
jgi:hypothetical protein